MAARIKNYHIEETRQKIRVSQLLNRLQNHADGEVDLTPTQLRAVEILLKKSLPDLSSIELKGDAENPLKMVIEWENVTE